MPDGLVSHPTYASAVRAPRRGAARAGGRGGRGAGVCALAASVPALAAGWIPLAVGLIIAAQIAFAASLLDRASRRVGPPAPGRAAGRPCAPWHALARPASVWRPSREEWPAGAPDVELSLN
jgi:hypothetical protein